MAKSSKFSARNSQVVKRGNAFSIDPRLIVVDYDRNPRTRANYGSDEEWAAFKNSIREYGVEQNVKCAVNQTTGEWHLTHGFRRMTAVLELIAEGVDIPSIAFDEDVDNEEQNLLSHLVLNNGLPMTDADTAETLHRLKKYGYTNMAELARKSGVPYQKVVNLLLFAETASKKVCVGV